MTTHPLDAVIEIIEQGPHSAPALTLYALISTLEFKSQGYLFKLDKLKDLNAEQRQIAYALMEMMVEERLATSSGKPLKPKWMP